MIRGTVVTIGNTKYILPPLNINGLERHARLLKAGMSGELTSEVAVEKFGELAEMIHSALRRNYPDVTLEQLKEDVDVANFDELFQAIVKTSGLVTSIPEEAPAGE